MRQMNEFWPAACSVPVLMLVTLALSPPTKQVLKTPECSNASAIDMANNVVKQGRSLLENGDVEGAVAKFETLRKLVPSKWMVDYHIACAYARSGKDELAFDRLETLTRNGFDYPDKLAYSEDFESLRTDPRFDEIVERARMNYERGTAAFAAGIPEYDETEDFSTEEELNGWVVEQDGLHYRHLNIWTATELLTAKIDMRARYLAALKTLMAGDPSFDYRRERVQASVRLNSLARPGWRAAADLVQHEVAAYARSSPDPNALAEANFLAGVALSLKYVDDDAMRVEGYDHALNYLTKIEEDSEYYGAAQALMLVNELKSPVPDEQRVGKELKAIVRKYTDNHDIYSIISTRLNHDAVHVLWPIPLDVPDIDGEEVSLDQYRGKIVLIDFWAITCVPCREEIPGLVEAYNDYHDAGFEIISVCLDPVKKTTPESLRGWISKNKMEWRHVYDGRAWQSELVHRFFVGTIPAPFLVGVTVPWSRGGDACRGDGLVANIVKALE